MQATAGKETACALVFSTNLQCKSTNPNLESFFLSAGEPFVSLLYFAQSHGDVSQPYSCEGASAPPCPGDRALHWFSWRHSCHKMAPPRHPLYGALFCLWPKLADTGFSALSVIQAESHLAKYLLFVFPSNTHTLQIPTEPPPTHRSIFCSLPCGVSMTLLAGHPHPSRVSCLPRSLSDRVDVTGE